MLSRQGNAEAQLAMTGGLGVRMAGADLIQTSRKGEIHYMTSLLLVVTNLHVMFAVVLPC